MTVLVTGATGFSGRALLDHFRTLGMHDIAGLSRSTTGLEKRLPGIRFIRCDLTDRQQVRDAIAKFRPSWIIHLGGLTHGTRAELFQANVTGTENLLDAVLEIIPSSKVLVVSSSAVYGFSGREPIQEDTPFRPLTDYGASKEAQEVVAMEMYTKGAHLAIARPFNLVGPGQPESFLCGRIVRQAVEIEQGKRGNLDLYETRSYRNFVDVRDAVRAYWALVSHPSFEQVCSGKAFNVGSDMPYAVSDVISFVEKITGRTYIVAMPEDPPVVPVPYQHGDSFRIRQVTGWLPGISLQKSLADMLAAARP